MSGKNAKLLERLIGLKPDFLEIREALGAPKTVGFGMLPRAHEEGSSAVLIQYFTKDGKFTYCKDWDPLSAVGFNPGIGDYHIVAPKKKRFIDSDVDVSEGLVSIYQNRKNPFDWKLADAPREALRGLIAHELSHMCLIVDGTITDRIGIHAEAQGVILPEQPRLRAEVVVDLYACARGLRSDIEAAHEHDYRKLLRRMTGLVENRRHRTGEAFTEEKTLVAAALDEGVVRYQFIQRVMRGGA
jgi:hypothetical protein